MQVVMIGSGYVGLVSGTCLAEVGHTVTCVDLNEEKIRQLQDGHSPIFEPGLESMIRRNLAHERLSFTTELGEALQEAELVFIAVGTPEGEDGSADVGYVRAAAESIGKLMAKDIIVVVKSTVPVGTCDMVEQTIRTQLEERKIKDYGVTVASNPEFLKEGNAVGDFMKPDRILVGLNESRYQDAFQKLYRPFILDDSGKLMFVDRRSSELTKYAANSMLATRISFMNELAVLCENLGANIDQVRQGVGADPRIGRKFLFPGPGYGGSCFPKDVAALRRTARQAGVELRVLDAVSEANLAQKSFATNKVLAAVGDLKGKIIAVWGLAFKPGTDDVRETPAATIVAGLMEKGAKVVAHDPQAIDNFSKSFSHLDGITYVQESYDALKGAHALVLITEWSEYRRPNWKKVAKLMVSPTVIDLRNQYESAELREMGFNYDSVGRPQS